MRISRVTPTLLLILVFAHPGFARAQAGAIANAGVGVLAPGDGATSLAISGGVGYRFNRSIGFGIELTHMPGLESGFENGIRPLGVYFDGSEDPPEGHATIFTTNVRIEIPTAMRRVIPYVTGGGGMAAVTEPYPIYYYALASGGTVASGGAAQDGSRSTALPVPSSAIYPPIYPAPQYISNTTVAMALTLGGGASILVTDHLAVDVDLRALKLLGETGGRSMARFGVGASYRF